MPPLFWVRLVSKGTPPERYTLQVPFQLGSPHYLKSSQPTVCSFGNLKLEIRENRGVYLLCVTGFDTCAQAHKYLLHVRGAFLRTIVGRQIGIRATGEIQQVQLNNPPLEISDQSDYSIGKKRGWTHVDGVVEPLPTVVIPEHLRIVEFGVSPLTVRMGMPDSMLLDSLIEGLSLPDPSGVALDAKLSLAIALYAESNGKRVDELELSQ